MAQFTLPRNTYLKVHAVGQANYTQAAIFEMWSVEPTPRLVLSHRSDLYWSEANFLLPVHPFNMNVTVNIRGLYLYTDTAWGTSTERLWESSADHLVLGYDDSRHRNPDNDYNDLILDIWLVSGTPQLLANAKDFLLANRKPSETLALKKVASLEDIIAMTMSDVSLAKQLKDNPTALAQTFGIKLTQEEDIAIRQNFNIDEALKNAQEVDSYAAKVSTGMGLKKNDDS